LSPAYNANDLKIIMRTTTPPINNKKSRRSTKAPSVTISIPGTTSNLGPGFDSFGLALDFANLVTITREAPSPIPLPPMVAATAESFFLGCGLTPFPFSWKIRGNVPQARGLGSSVTVRLGILMGLNELSGHPISREGIFRLCAQLEGHPDNAAPAIYGGFSIARSLHEPLRYRVAATLRFILLIPNFEVATPDARKVMPQSISVADAAANAADAAVIAAAFATKHYELLRGAFGDRLHQPYRTRLVPFLPDVITAGEKAGALGGWLSGSGSTICCLALDTEQVPRIARAMKKQSPKGSKILICEANNRGASMVRG
jgi:homoserine kinase